MTKRDGTSPNWGGRRVGSGRKPKPGDEAKATVPAEPKAPDVAARRRLQTAIDVAKSLTSAAQRRSRRDPTRHPFRLPDYPACALPPEDLRMDKVAKTGAGLAMDASLGWAGQAWSGQTIGGLADAGLEFMGYPFLSILAQRPEYRIMSETIADDATRRWIDFEVVGAKRQEEKEREEQGRQRQSAAAVAPASNPIAGTPAPGRSFEDPDPDERRKTIERAGKMDKVKAIKDELSRLEARDRLYCNSRDDGFFGRSHLYLNFGTDIDGDAPDELRVPIGDGRDSLSRAKVGRDRPLKSLRVIEPVWTYPTTYNAVNPLREDWYNPQVWYVLGKEIHRSRLPTFIGHPVPDLLKPAYSFGGLSLSQMAKPYVDIWLKTRSAVGELIHSFSVMVLMTDMQTILQDGSPGAAGLLLRADEFNAFRDNQNLFVLNKESEDFKNVSASLAGLHELQSQAQEHMASICRIPLVKFTGISPSGLNACLVGDTLIETDRGYIPIRDVRPGQRVMTREGWAPIAKAGCTGYATELIEIKTAGTVVRCTADHRVWLPLINEFVPARDVRPGDLLLSRGAIKRNRNTASLSPIAADSGGGHRSATTPRHSIMRESISCTGRFGGFTTGLFRKAITFITSTKTARTINSKISSLSQLLITQGFTASDSRLASTSGNAAIAASLSSSWGNPPGLSSAADNAGSPTAERTGRREPSLDRHAFASFAESLSRPSARTQNIALEGVRPRAKIDPNTRQVTTESIEKNGSDTIITSAELESVTDIRLVPAQEYVYDIQVETGFLPEFFANNICVHNSSEGEIRVYYDTIAAYQNRFFRPNLTKLINFVQLSLFDEVDPEITFEFEPLWEMSEQERAELQQKQAEMHKTYVEMGSIGNDEVRQVAIDDPKLPYADLNPEDVPELREEEEQGLIPEGGGRAIEGLLEQGPGAGAGPAPQQEEKGAAPRAAAAGTGGRDPAFEDDGAGGGGADVLPFLHPAADAKLGQAEAGYVPSIEDVSEQCSQCEMFRRVVDTFDGNRCTLVEGDISALGHCDHFRRLSPGRRRDGPDSLFGGAGTGARHDVAGDEQPWWAEGSRIGPEPLGKTVHDADWDESKHKRGQPGNAGQFGSGGGSAQQNPSTPQRQQVQAQHPAATTQQQQQQQQGQQGQLQVKRDARAERQRAFGQHIAEQLEKLDPAGKEKHAKHAKKTREFFSSDGSRRATAKAVGDFVRRHAMGVAQHHIRTAMLMPVVHHVVEQAVEMTGLGSVPGVTLGATAVAAYTVHHLMHEFGFSLEGGVELLKDAVKGAMSVLRGTKEVAESVARLEHESGVTARDAEPDPVLDAMAKLQIALEELGERGDDQAQDEAPFDESKHPRDEGGKFTEKGTGSGGSSETSAPPKEEAGTAAQELPAREKRTKFGGLWRKGSSPADEYKINAERVLAKQTNAGSSYRALLEHLIKEAPKHGGEKDVPALRAKLIESLQWAKKRAEENAGAPGIVQSQREKFAAMAAKASARIAALVEQAEVPEPKAGVSWATVGDPGPELASFREGTHDELIKRGQETNVENLSGFDLKTNKPMAADFGVASRGASNVQFSPELIAMLQDPNNEIELHHNHPTDRPLSAQDLSMVQHSPGLRRVYAHGHLGSVYSVDSVTSASDIYRQHQVAARAIRDGLRETKKPKTLEESMYPRFFDNAVVAGLAKAGLIKGFKAYLAPDLERAIKTNQDLFDNMTDRAAAAVTAKPDKDYPWLS